MSKPFTARYSGHCQGCHSRIEPGDEVVYDEDDALVHAGCSVPEEKPVNICKRCNMTMPCFCD